MKKRIAFILVFLALLAVCPLASVETVSTQPPVLSDLTPLLSMARSDVTALIGQGEALHFEDFSDYQESGLQLGGFPYEYSACGGVRVFYDAAPKAADTVPYGCVENPGDLVLGIMLKADSTSCNVAGFQAALNAESVTALKKEFKAEVEHVNGLYEYYSIRAEIGGILYVWVSDYADMKDSVMYASPVKDTGNK